MNNSRPYVIPKKYTWKSGDRTATPGIGLLYGKKIRAHLTAKEAYDLANRLVDLADTLETLEDAAITAGTGTQDAAPLTDHSEGRSS